MANSWGFDGSQYYPPYLSAWSKTVLNYVTPTIINASSTYYASAVAFIPQVYFGSVCAGHGVWRVVRFFSFFFLHSTMLFHSLVPHAVLAFACL